MKRTRILAGAAAVALPLVTAIVARNLLSWRPHLVAKTKSLDPDPETAEWSRDGSTIRLSTPFRSGSSRYRYVDTRTKHTVSQNEGRAAFLHFAPFELRSPSNATGLRSDETTSVCNTSTKHCVALQSVAWNSNGSDLCSNPCHFSSDGRQLWLVADTAVFRWSSATGKVQPPLHFDVARGEKARFETISEDLTQVVARLSHANRTVVFDTRTGRKRLSLSQNIDIAWFSPSGRWIGGTDGSPIPSVTRVFDARTGRQMWQHPDSFPLLFSPDDRLVAISGPNGVELLDARTGQPQRTLASTSQTFFPFAFSPDSGELLTLDMNQIVSWRVR